MANGLCVCDLLEKRKSLYFVIFSCQMITFRYEGVTYESINVIT